MVVLWCVLFFSLGLLSDDGVATPVDQLTGASCAGGKGNVCDLLDSFFFVVYRLILNVSAVW